MPRASTLSGREPSQLPELNGTTRIDACCTFDWIQRGILRSVFVDETKHYDCVQKLLALADADRLSVLLVYRSPSGGGQGLG